jgi:hypothetical protein
MTHPEARDPLDQPDQPGRSEPPEAGSQQFVDLPVEDLPADAPGRAYAAADAAPGHQDPARTAHQATAERGPKAVMAAYAAALGDADAGLAADLYAENSLLTSADERISGRAGIAGWHEDLLRRGRVVATPAGQGNDASRLEVDSAAGRHVVELAFDASGRIGTARWLTPAEANLPQEARERSAT